MMKTLQTLLIVMFLMAGGSLLAQDRIFTYVYQSGVLAKGEKELEVWTTLRTGREQYFRALDTRAEFEIGLGSRLQTAFYLNYSAKAWGSTDIGLSTLEHESDFSFSNEWKYKISDPAANVLGSALYGELTVGPAELEVELKVILDKQLGRTTHALNLAFEPEWEWGSEGSKIQAQTEYKFEFSYGLGVRLGKGWNLGAEVRNPNVAADGAWEHSALYAGPTMSYAGKSYWVNLTFMPQVAGLRGITPNSCLNLSEYERYQARLLFSYML
jgi:hypothetical protein